MLPLFVVLLHQRSDPRSTEGTLSGVCSISCHKTLPSCAL